MKTTIFELLRMVKDGKAPKKIYFDKLIWKYEEFEGLNSDGTTFVSKDYKNIETDDGLFDLYIITDILNEPVEILETTITYKQDNKIEKLEHWVDIKSWAKNDLERGLEEQSCFNKNIYYKINEIIDRINNE